MLDSTEFLKQLNNNCIIYQNWHKKKLKVVIILKNVEQTEFKTKKPSHKGNSRWLPMNYTKYLRKK